MPNVGPELLHDVENAVECDLIHPLLARFGPGPFATRVVEVRNTSSCAVADDLGKVKCRATGIRPSDEQPADGVSGAREEISVETSVVAWVLASDGRHNELGEVVANGLVNKGVPEIAGISVSSLVELGISVTSLSEPSHESGNHQGRVVEAVLCSEQELAFG